MSSDQEIVDKLEVAEFWLQILGYVVLFVSLALSGYKIFRQNKITDWFPVMIWILVLVTFLLAFADDTY